MRGGSVCRYLACDIDIVFDGDGNTEQWQPLACVQPVLRDNRLLTGRLGENNAERAQPAVQPRYPIQVQLQKFGRGDGSVGEHPGLLRGACEGKLTTIHVFSYLTVRDGIFAPEYCQALCAGGHERQTNPGDRFASILDPFGQRWTVMTRVEDVAPEERGRRMADWAKGNIGS
jgi:hypothetical protein